MSTEQFEQQAQQLTMETTRQSVRLTGTLTRTTFDEARSLVGEALIRAGRAVTGRGDGRTLTGGRTTVRSLEQVTRGARTGVDLTNPDVARQVQQELGRQGVTFAVTRAEGQYRIHIAAGNAEQLNHALEVAEARVARRVERQEVRSDDRAAARAAVQERVRSLAPKERPMQSDPEVVQMVTLGVRGNDEAARQERVQRAQAILAGRGLVEDAAYRNARPMQEPDVANSGIEYALIEAKGDVSLAVQDRRFVEVMAERLHVAPWYRESSEEHPVGRWVYPIEQRENFDKLLDVVGKAHKDFKAPKLTEKVLAKVMDLDRIPAVERVMGGGAR